MGKKSAIVKLGNQQIKQVENDKHLGTLLSNKVKYVDKFVETISE